MTRGIKVIEELLSKRIKFCSGPEWLYNNVLINKKVIAYQELMAKQQRLH